MSSMALFEFYLRTSGATLMVLLALLMIRDARDVRAARFGALLSVSIAGVLIAYAGGERWSIENQTLIFFIRPMSTNSVLFIWWFARALLDDEFRLRRADLAVFLVWNGLGAVNFQALFFQAPLERIWAAQARSLISLLIVAHIVFVAFAGRAADLIEARRRVRVALSTVICFLYALSISIEFAYGYEPVPPSVTAAQFVFYLAVSLWSFWWLTQINREMLTFERKRDTTPAADTLSPKERQLKERLLAVVEGERAFLEPALSIGALSARIKAPEHQVRALINKSLGFRNFRAFLNSYRLMEAKAALADPGKAALPVLTIAMDAGFASLAPFNRAFKELTGETPTAFRARAMSGDRGTSHQNAD